MVVFEHDELLVCAALYVRRDAFFGESAADLLRELCRSFCDLEIQPVLEQRVELQAEQPALGEHRAVLFDVAAEVDVQLRVWDDERLAEEGAAFCAAAVEHIGQPREILHRHIIFGGAEPVAEPAPAPAPAPAPEKEDRAATRRIDIDAVRRYYSGDGDAKRAWDEEDELTTPRPKFDFTDLKFGSNYADEAPTEGRKSRKDK